MVFIIGAGPIGLACGIALKERNIPFLIFDKGPLVNSIFHYPVNMTFFSTAEKIEIGGIPFISHGPKPTRREALEYYRRVATHYELPLHLYEGVQKVQPAQRGFIVETERATYRAQEIILATGFYGLPVTLNVPGEKLPKVKHYYDEPHPYAFKKVAVIGAGNSGVDVALETFRCGSEVSLIVRDDQIKPSVKYWVRPDIENRIKAGEIKAYFSSSLSEIREKEIDILTPNGIETIENDFVLAMTGYQPDYHLLRSIGIALEDDSDQTPFFDPTTHESSIRNLYLAGVVCGGLNTGKWFIENSISHASIIAEAIAERRS